MTTKRVTSLLLTLVLLLNLLPTAFAADSEAAQEPSLEYSELYEGLFYGEDQVTNEEGNNVNTFVLSVDGDDDSLEVVTGVPNDETPLTAGLVQTTSGQAMAAQQNGKHVLAAVNADFFHMGDDTAIQPCGLTIKDGELLVDYCSDEDTVRKYFFGVKEDGTAVIGDKTLYEEVADDLEQAVGGGPWLVTEGEIIDNSSDTARHPRTAVGITADGDILLVVADGRTTASAGFTYDELAEYMLSLGAVEALNLDGGGSSASVVKNSETYAFEVMNYPSDGTERPVGDTLLVIDTDAAEAVGPELDQAEDGYYLIEEASDFNQINKAPNENYRLANDIILEDEIISSVSMLGGDFDGAGHTIYGLTTDSSNGYALFSTLLAGGSVHDLTLKDVDITTGGSAAALVQTCYGTVENVVVEGNISGGSSVGGLVGYMSEGGYISKCSVGVNVTGSSDVAGLVGKMLYGCNIDSCYVNANVVGVTRVGGLAGYAVSESNQTDSYITNCIIRGSVKATNIEAGGVGGLLKVGVNNCIVEDMTVVDTGTGATSSGNVAGLLGAWCNGSRPYTCNVIKAGSITTESENCVAHRIGYHSTNKSNNYVAQTVTINGQPETGGTHDNNIGADATAEQLSSKSFYEELNYDFETVFDWDEEHSTPILRDVDQTVEIPEVVADTTVIQSNISLSVGADETQMNFTWYCTAEDAGTLLIAKESELVDGAMPDTTMRYTATATKANDGTYSNQAVATDLEVNTTYAYQLINGETASEVHTFTTDDGADFSFAYVADPQIGAGGNSITDSEGWANTLSIVDENEIFSDISFMLSAGDQVNTASDENQYDLYLEHEALLDLPVATVIGNHDSGSDAYNEHFNVANESTEYGTTDAGGDYYFVYNNVLFMVLNSNDQSTAEHKAFMEAAIAANPDVSWKIVTFHHSLYTVASHAEDSDILSRRETFVPILDELDIDVVLMGHDHVYCRTYMMDGFTPMTDASIYDDESYSSITDPEGILYVTANSGSGSKYYTIKNTVYNYSAVQNQEKVPNVSLVTVSDEAFTITTYRTSDMTVVDTFTINHTISEDPEISAAEQVETSIDAIGEVTLDGMDVINAARDAYDTLTDEEKAEVANYQTLLNAEHTYAILKAEAAQAAAEAALAAAEEAQAAAEAAQKTAEEAAASAAEDKAAAQQAQEAAEGAKAAAEAAQQAAETAEAAAEAANVEAAEQAAASAQSAAAAAQAANAAAEACLKAQEAQAAAEAAAAQAKLDREAAEKAEQEAKAAAEAAELALEKFNALNDLSEYVDNVDFSAHAEDLEAAIEQAKAAINDAETIESVAAALEAGKQAINSAECFSQQFDDVDLAKWYHESLDYVLANGLMQGFTDGTFQPDGTLTRAMLVQILYNMEGQPESDAQSQFSDVTETKWYYNAVVWAAENGIVNGYTDGTFKPDEAITREQLVTIFWRYAGEPETESTEVTFDDAENVSAYAENAVTWATENNIVNGMGNNRFAPKAGSTRAQTAKILKGYCELMAG